MLHVSIQKVSSSGNLNKTFIKHTISKGFALYFI